MKGLRIELTSDSTTSYTLSITLLLCLLEICDAKSVKWLLHLYGAEILLTNASEAVKADRTLSFLVDLYNYLCCISSITFPTVPRIFGSQVQRLHGDNTASAIHPLFGTAAGLYESLHRIGLAEENHDIELTLNNWAVPDDLQPQISSRMTEANAVTFAIQWAIIIWLRSQFCDSSHSQIQKAVDEILSVLSLIRPGSLVETCTFFPYSWQA
jgi:hypothetical protein